MRKTLTVILLGASWAVLAGCEQQGQETLPEPADGLPQNEAPRTDPDVQIGRSDSVEPVEPVEPAQPGGAGPDIQLEGDQPPPAGNEPADSGPDLQLEGDQPQN